MTDSRWEWSGKLWAAVLAVVVCCTPWLTPEVAAQAAGGEKFLKINSVKPLQKTESGKRYWEVLIVGETKVLPVGTIIEFQVRQGQNILERFDCTIDESRRFKLQHAAHHLKGFAKELFIRTEIDYQNQSKEVQEEMKKRPDVFWQGSSPWHDSHLDKRFDLGKESDLKRQREEVQQYFLDSVVRLVDIDRKMGEARSAAVDKSRFNKEGKLDTSAWRRWLKQAIRDPIRKVQKGIRERQGTLKFLRHKRDMGYLNDIAKGIAFRSVNKSLEVYKAFKLDPDIEDRSPTDLELRRINKRFLGSRVRQLCESQEIQNPLEK